MIAGHYPAERIIQLFRLVIRNLRALIVVNLRVLIDYRLILRPRSVVARLRPRSASTAAELVAGSTMSPRSIHGFPDYGNDLGLADAMSLPPTAAWEVINCERS